MNTIQYITAFLMVVGWILFYVEKMDAKSIKAKKKKVK